eukprot:GHVH01011045.1.p1 GENE.GHVH01011045.1~~GHVH01011045.1.p1  ORF type:complete len:273 (+),score=26.32 GHVH01011045.1:23-820(+)
MAAAERTLWRAGRLGRYHLSGGELVPSREGLPGLPPLYLVPPYWSTLTTTVKRRWVGRSLLNVFIEEFKSKSKDYYMKAIELGYLTVQHEEAIDPSFTLKDHHVIVHKSMIVEYPFQAEPEIGQHVGGVRILKVLMNGQAIAMHKPCGIPTISQGRHHTSSLLSLARVVLGLSDSDYMHPCHRLDKLTSGLVVLSRSKGTSQRLSNCINKDTTVKVYLAKVVGRPQTDEMVVENRIGRPIEMGSGERMKFTSQGWSSTTPPPMKV